MNEPRTDHPETARPLSDYGSVVGLTLLGIGLSVSLWHYGRSQEQARIRLELEAAADNYAAAIQRSLSFSEALVNSLRSGQARLAARPAIAFHAFTTPLSSSLRGVVALEWVPRVRHAERPSYEEAMRRAGVEGFTIKERDAQGRLVPAGRRPEYFPVSHVDPGEDAGPVVGFDLGSEETRSRAIRRAADSGTTVATPRLRLVETPDQYGFQLFGPVFEPGRGLGTDSGDADTLEGLVVGVFRISNLVEDALEPLSLLEVELEVLDTTTTPEGDSLFRRTFGRSEPRDERDLQHESQVTVGGRTWLVRTRMPGAVVADRGTRNPAGLLLAGLSTSALLGVGLLLNARKTAAIRAGNARLTAAIREGVAAQDALRRSELRFRAVVEEQRELILRWDLNERLTFVSPSLARFLDRPAEQLEGSTLREALGEETAEALTSGLSSLTGSEVGGIVELQLDDAEGRRFWYGWTRQVRHDDDGRIAHLQAVGRDISSRRRAQEKLREQEERFRLLSEAAFEGIALTFEGRIVDSNPQLAQMLGYEISEVRGREVADLVAPESRADVARRIRANDEGPYEHLALRRDGRRIHVEVRARAVTLGDRAMRISAIRDVTQQKRAREELARSRAFLDTIFTGLEMPVWVVDVGEDGSLRPVASNPAWERLLGVSLAEAGAPGFAALERLLPRDDVRAEEAAIRRCIATGQPVREAVTDGLLARSGKDFLRQLNPLRDEAGRTFRVIGSFVDVTELRRAERTLREGQRLLAEAQRIARLGAWEFDLPSGPLRLSEQAWSILGEPSPPPGDAWSWEVLEALVREDDRPALQPALARLRAGETVSEQLRLSRPDGSFAAVLLQGETDPAARGAPARLVGTLQDVTERRRAEEAAERQRRELVQADKMIALGTLLSGVAHEINNPNHYILLNLPLLRAAWRDALPVLDAHADADRDFSLGGLPYAEMREELPSLLDEVIQGAERIKFIVSELRSYTREQTHSTHPVSLNDAVRSALTLLSSPIRKATRRFSVEYGEDLPRVRGNPRRLQQIVINLVLNACQALGSPDRAIEVETSYDGEEGRAVVAVRDEGCGIPESDLARITDPFFTTKRERGGTGLGLAVSARIAEEHGGRISFDSRVGQGTTARLSLPIVEDDA